MALPEHLFDDDQRTAEGDLDESIVWKGEEFPSVVVDQGESSDYLMPGKKARRRIVVEVRRSLFLEDVPEVGQIVTCEDVIYRIRTRKSDSIVSELECEEEDA